MATRVVPAERDRVPAREGAEAVGRGERESVGARDRRCAFVNEYAAVPSLHFGWNLLVGMTWFRVGRRRVWRVAGVVMPVAMAWAVVVTANHWVLDAVAGAVVALVGLAIARFWRARRHGRLVSDTGR